MFSKLNSFSRIGLSHRPERSAQSRIIDQAKDKEPCCQPEISDNAHGSSPPQRFITALSPRRTRTTSGSPVPSRSSLSRSGHDMPSHPDNLRRCSSDLKSTTLSPADEKKSRVSIAFSTGRANVLRPASSPKSGHSSRESNGGQQRKERRTLPADPPPYLQGHSNVGQSKSSHPSVIDVFDQSLPRVDLSSLPLVTEADSASSPDLEELPSEEIRRRRRLQKVRRMLGERIPPELVNHGDTRRIANDSALPNQPSFSDAVSRHEQKEMQSNMLASTRRTSLAPSSFPTLSSVSATLFPIGRALANNLLKGEVQGQRLDDTVNGRLDKGVSSPIFKGDPPAPRTRTYRASNKSRPSTADGSSGSHPQRFRGMENASHVPRRASIQFSGMTLPSNPGQNGITNVMEPPPDIGAHFSQRGSTLLSPIKFSNPTTFQLVVEDESSSDPPTPPTLPTPPRRRKKSHKESESVRGYTSSSPSPDLDDIHPLATPRSEIPFADSAVPLEPGLQVPRVMQSDHPRNSVVRRERRQGWSGEWNCEDMQDVIKKLRSLK